VVGRGDARDVGRRPTRSDSRRLEPCAAGSRAVSGALSGVVPGPLAGPDSWAFSERRAG
jgi:hypothetical protein